MSNVIGYTRKELILLMLDNGIHCSVDKFEEVAIALQQKVRVDDAESEKGEAHETR